MFADDIALVSEMVAKYGAKPPLVECGGLPDPVIAAYDKTIEAMDKLRRDWEITHDDAYTMELSHADVLAAQHARYLRIHRPLEDACPGYLLEDPSTGGLAIERLSEKYPGTIGTAILLSVLEHVDDPFGAVSSLRSAMARGGLAIVSVPFEFPWHPSPQDHWRFSPTGLRKLFEKMRTLDEEPIIPSGWEVLETDWRLDIPAEAGVIDLKTNRAQAIKSCYLVARAV